MKCAGKNLFPVDEILITERDGVPVTIRVYEDDTGGVWYAAEDVRAACSKPNIKCRGPYACYVIGKWPMLQTMQLITFREVVRLATAYSRIPARLWRNAFESRTNKMGEHIKWQ